MNVVTHPLSQKPSLVCSNQEEDLNPPILHYIFSLCILRKGLPSPELTYQKSYVEEKSLLKMQAEEHNKTGWTIPRAQRQTWGGGGGFWNLCMGTSAPNKFDRKQPYQSYSQYLWKCVRGTASWSESNCCIWRLKPGFFTCPNDITKW